MKTEERDRTSGGSSVSGQRRSAAAGFRAHGMPGAGAQGIAGGARTAAPVLVLLAAALLAGCGGPGTEARTFDVTHMNPEQAAELVRPYVGGDGGGEMSVFGQGITVRATPETLERIEEVLRRYDRPEPGVRLHFQLIEADGPGEPDPRISSVESALRELFRFEGYRLLDEAQMGTVAGSRSTQVFRVGDRQYGIEAWISDVRTGESGSAARLSVELRTTAGPVLETTMNVPMGKTVVLGSGRPDPDQEALILTVRPELAAVAATDSTG